MSIPKYPPIKIPPEIKETKYPGYYVSMEGNVYRSPGKTDRNRQLNQYNLITLNFYLRGNPLGKKYQYFSVNISIRDENGNFIRQQKVNVHRLIAETFIPNPNNYDSVDHIDRNKHNNNVTNLRWCTTKENMKSWERDSEYREKNKKLPKKGPHAKIKHKNTFLQKNPPPKKSPHTLLGFLEGCVCWLVNSIPKDIPEIDRDPDWVHLGHDI